MRIFFSVGEPSGDQHAAHLIRVLRARHPGVECVGFGGPKMAAAGCQLHFELTALAVMWLLRVLVNLHKFLWLCGQADLYFRHHRPDAVVLVDYPGFNWWIAWRAKLYGIPTFYYSPPQIWAWAGWRIGKMRRYVDHVLCCLPLEEQWFRQRGLRATYVGHPFFDEVARQQLEADFLAAQRDPARPLVAILPGSRTQEVEQNLPWLLKAAATIQAHRRDVRFAVACYKAPHARLAHAMIAATGLDIDVHVRRTPELIELCHCCLAVSGSVSLELLAKARPTVILYWIPRFAYWVQSHFRKTRYITLVNLLASSDPFLATARESEAAAQAAMQPDNPDVLFPEFLTWHDPTRQIADQVLCWLEQPERRDELVARLEALRGRVGQPGAPIHAAEYLLRVLAERERPVVGPHYRPGAREQATDCAPASVARTSQARARAA